MKYWIEHDSTGKILFNLTGNAKPSPRLGNTIVNVLEPAPSNSVWDGEKIIPPLPTSEPNIIERRMDAQNILKRLMFNKLQNDPFPLASKIPQADAAYLKFSQDITVATNKAAINAVLDNAHRENL